MELPHLGKQCSESTCRKLDFLPFTCSLCRKTFCLDHFKYDAHNCKEKHRADAQVPICPLCNEPVANKPNQLPDLAVNDHLENNCKIKKNKLYTNKCFVKGCKNKEFLKIKCDVCGNNYCLRHRHTGDHNCAGPVSNREKALRAAQSRMQRESRKVVDKGTEPKPTLFNSSQSAGGLRSSSQIASLQGNLREDEALAKAMAMSLGVSEEGPNESSSFAQESDDLMLAQALAASLEDGKPKPGRSKSDNCCLS